MKLTYVLGNTWVLEGDTLVTLYRLGNGRCILIDSGRSFEQEEMFQALELAGLIPVGVMSTHLHSDHTGNNAWLKKTYDCLTALPEGEARPTLFPTAVKEYLYFYTPQMALDIQGGNLAQPDRLIPRDAELFNFCDVTFRIVHTPGHTSDHIAIITPDNVCHVGDALISNELMRAKMPYALSIQQMLKSAQLLGSLNCNSYIVSHRGIHTEIDTVISETRKLFMQRAEDICALIRRPMTFYEVWTTANDHFKLLSSRISMVLMIERNLRSFLDYLVDTGHISIVARAGMFYYTPNTKNLEAVPLCH